MRVLFVITSLGAGGTERSTAVLLPELRARGIDATVVCLVHRDEGDEAAVRAQGFDVHLLRSTSWVGRVRELRALIRRVRPDLIHTAIFDADVVGRVAAVGTGVPVLGSLVNTAYDPARRRDPNVTPWKLAAVHAVDAATARLLATHLHAVTEGVAADAVRSLRVPRARIGVVERGRDDDALGRRTDERRAAARAQLGLADDDVALLAVGRQEYQKGHDVLVEALATLVADRPELQLLIAGRPGNATRAIEAAIDAQGLGERVRLLGHRDDVPDLLCAADLFVMPSRYEGTAGAAIEALALEVPIVMARVAGAVGVIDEDVAVLVPPDDASALARAIARVLDAPADAEGRVRRGRERFEQRFTLDASASGMVALYAQVAPGGRRRSGRRERSRDGTGVGPRLAPLADASPAPDAADEPIELSVILCVRNGAATMAGQLDAVLAQTWDRPWELVVVDNGSTDATRAVADRYAARDPRVRVVDASSRRGLSHARNVGVRHARGRSVAFCDDDDRVGDGWLAAMGRALEDHEVVASRMEYERLQAVPEDDRAGVQSQGVEHLFGLPIVNGASGYRRARWLELGGNDEDLDYSGEDHDLALRAHLQAGIEPAFAADAVYHVGRRQNARATFRQSRRYGRAHVMLYDRYGRGREAPPSIAIGLRRWAWLARHAGDLLDRGRRTRWAWHAGIRVGRLHESLRRRTWYP